MAEGVDCLDNLGLILEIMEDVEDLESLVPADNRPHCQICQLVLPDEASLISHRLTCTVVVPEGGPSQIIGFPREGLKQTKMKI